MQEKKVLNTYNAILKGNELEWLGEKPEGVGAGRPLKVQVKIVEEESEQKKPNGKLAVEALEKLAAMGGIKSIPDPVAWQREIRKDRPLPGRE
jgi:hypothetical protein